MLWLEQSCPNPFKLWERSRCKGVVDAKSQQQGSFTFRNSVGTWPVHRLHQHQKFPFCCITKTRAALRFLVFLLLLLEGGLRKIPGQQKKQVCCAFPDPEFMQYLPNYPAAPTSVTALIWQIRAFLAPDWLTWRSPLKHILLRWSPIGVVFMQPICNPCSAINWNSSLVDSLQLYWWFAKAIKVNFFSFESSSPVLMICRSNPKTTKRVNWYKNKATHLQFRSLNPTRIIRGEIWGTSYQKRLHCCHGVPSCNLQCSCIFKLVNQWGLQLQDQLVTVDTEANPSCKQNCWTESPHKLLQAN